MNEQDDQIVRSTKLRSAIIQWLYDNEGLYSATVIAEGIADTIKELGYKPDYLYTLLPQMASNNSIGSETKGRSRLYYHNRYKEVLASAEVTARTGRAAPKFAEKKQPPAPKAPAPVPQALPAATQELPQLKVDLVKGTNRVRVTTKDFTIEIGVVEK
jgi:hypothetical protein